MIVNRVDKHLEYLKKITEDLATEIRDEEHGLAFEFCKRVADNIKSMVVIVDKKDTVLYMNPAFKKNLKNTKSKLEIGQKWYEGWNLSKPPDNFPITECIKTKKMLIKDYQSPLTGRFLHTVLIPLAYDGVSGVICIMDYGDEQ